ncbi:MAG: lysylphosphatidylglycerol synthase transmembrane domain-containing protein [Mangrovibacterium sp.]|nr:lysylphosphatidylglycerol synthase transmembrane domain-containing protein [Mangrovibacterium sp.]
MKLKLVKLLQFLGFLGLGLILFWLVYKDQDIVRIKSILKNDVNYTWIWASLFLCILSVFSRTLRWRLMIEPLGRKPSIRNTFLSVMVGYLMNLVLPRMGEVSRCGVLARYEKTSFTQLVGTVVTERIADMLMLLLLTLAVILTQLGTIIQLLENNPEMRGKLSGIALSPWFLAGIGGLILAGYLFRKKIRKSAFFSRICFTVKKFGEGLKTVVHMRNKWKFIFHTLFIWLMYYLMLYLAFFSFDFTARLSPLAGLTTFVLSSYGMVAPVQGGIGAWHFMVIQCLFVYGVAKPDGVIFAFLSHSSMTGLYIVAGLISLLILPFLNRRNDAQ